MSSENHKVTWFAPDRPVEGGTIYVRPDELSDAQIRRLQALQRWIERPRVWLTDDTVPAGVRVLAPNNYVIPPNSRPYRAATPLVEMPEMPAFGDLVAEEKARRAERMDAVAEAAGGQHG